MLRHLALAALFAAICVAPAWAIPTNPDPIHTPAATPWPNPLPPGFNPAVNQHQHWNADNLNGVPGQFITYSVWDDSTYRYARGVPTQGHGYMANPATYEYDMTVPEDAKFHWKNNSVGNWKMTINGRSMNSNAHEVVTRINFEEVAMLGDIVIRFAPTYMRDVPAAGGGEDYIETPFPSSGEIDPDGTWGGNPHGGNTSDGVLAYWTPGLKELTFNSNVQWYYLNVANGPAPGQYDFISTALHEFGHVLGLRHEGAAGTVMFPRQASYIDNGMGMTIPFDITTEVRNLDFGTITGSKVLYTIATPEPSSAVLALVAGLIAVVGRRRHR
jgi:hypothetical protein